MIDLTNFRDFSLLIFYFIYAVLLPGYLLARALMPPSHLNRLSSYLPGFERSFLRRYLYFIFSGATGLILLDAVVMLLAKLNLALSFDNYFMSFSALNVILILVNLWVERSGKLVRKETKTEKHQWFYLLIVLLFLVSVIVRTVFYLPDVVPQDTDLGHHMYWSQLFVQKEAFPNYDTPEVIEGEHMIFAVLSKVTGITLLSALPLIILSFYNLVMILGLALSVLVLSGNRKIALWSLFFSGIYFAIDPPQARYVKGGVIGNTFGNFFTVLVFLLVFMFVRYWLGKYFKLNQTKKDEVKSALASLFSLMLVIIAGSFYTHHLSTLLMGISLIFSVAVWLGLTFFWIIRNIGGTFSALGQFLKNMLFAPKLLITLGVVLIFPLLIYMPHYLLSQAIDTVTQVPIKDTHQGLPLETLSNKTGWLRLIFALGAIGFFVMFGISSLVSKTKYLKNIKLVKINLEIDTVTISLAFLILGWALPLFILSFYPSLMQIDLPSQRIVNYLVFPVIILAAGSATIIYDKLKNNISKRFFKAVAIILGFALLWEGTADFRGVYKMGENKFQEAVEIYSVSRYLAASTSDDARILKDHRTISGDSWIKFFFLRGYDYLVSRTYDYKYNAIDSKLDPCTREMIIVPGSSLSRMCYGQTGINYVIVKPAGDEYLFWKDEEFNAIYLNDDIAVFRVD